LYETAVRGGAGRKPVIAGTGCASTRETIALTKRAADAGIDTMLIVVPSTISPPRRASSTHYKAVAESTDADIILYNIPIFVGVNLEPENVGRLAPIRNIIGIKDEAGVNPTQVTDYCLAAQAADPDFLIYNGDDVMLLPTIVQGAIGIVSGGAHVFGHEIRAIFDAFAAGENERARDLFIPLYRFCKACGQNGRLLPNSIMRPASSWSPASRWARPRAAGSDHPRGDGGAQGGAQGYRQAVICHHAAGFLRAVRAGRVDSQKEVPP
jgi:4-hydroxy-tetrahydrodipicolinate synthase